MNWVELNQKEGETYSCVNRFHNIIGKRFNRIEMLHNYREIENLDEVMKYLESHTVSNVA